MKGYNSWNEVLNDVNKEQWAKYSGARPIWLNSKPIYDSDLAKSLSLSSIKKTRSILAITENSYTLEINETSKIQSKTYALAKIHATSQELVVKSLPGSSFKDPKYAYYSVLKSINDFLGEMICSESFCNSNGFTADVNALYDLQMKYNLSTIYLKVDAAKKVVLINTSDFILAALHPDEFAKVVTLKGKQVSEEAIRMLVETTNIEGSLLLGEYFYRHLGNITGKYRTNQYAQLGMARDSLTDLIPIAVRFAESDKADEIETVNQANIYFNKLLDKETKILPNTYITQEHFNKFQDLLIVLNSPVSIYGNDSMENQILFTTRDDLLWLTGGLLYDHTIDLVGQIFTHLITSLYAETPYGSTAWREKFNSYCVYLSSMKGANKSHSFQVVNAIQGEIKR